MPDDPQKLIHRTVRAAAVPYAPSQNPISESISLNAGNDLIAVIDPLSNQGEGWFERRPGWNSAFETSPTTFAAAPSRLFEWRKWAGAFYVIANVITGGNSLVYKYRVGLDTAFVLLYTSSGSTEPFDFVVSNNYLYFSDGSVNLKWDGTDGTVNTNGTAVTWVSGTQFTTGTSWNGKIININGSTFTISSVTNATALVLTGSAGVHSGVNYFMQPTNWGIAAPTIQPQTGWNAAGGNVPISASFGYKYVYAFYNSITGHLSSPSPVSNILGAFTVAGSLVVNMIGAESADTQVDTIKIFRTTDGGDGVFYEQQSFANSPNSIQTPGGAVFYGTGPYGQTEITTSGTYGIAGTSFHYVVIVTAAGTPDTFKWSDDDGLTFTTGVAITGAAQSLSHGISLTFAHTTGHAVNDRWDFSNWRTIDQSFDYQLTASSKINAPSNTNDPPTSMKGCKFFANRIWGLHNDHVHFSGFEEILNGVPEECFPPNNTFRSGDEVMGISQAGDGLLLMCASHTEKITGNSLDTFRIDNFFRRTGTRQRATMVSVGNGLAWLDSSGIVRMTDGYTQSEISRNIRADLTGIDPTKAAMTFHTDGRRQFILLLDGGASKVRVYDMDLDIWMPPWSVTGGCIASLETSQGIYQLMLGHSSGKVMVNDFAHYTDNGSTYAPQAVTQLFSLVQNSAGYIGDLEYVSIESDAVQPLTVSVLTDDDPSTGSFVAVTANVVSPSPLRSQGSNLLEKWYYARTPAARRASIKLTWANNSTNFKLYGFDVASYRNEQ